MRGFSIGLVVAAIVGLAMAPAAPANLIAWWDFNTATGSNVNDVSGNGLVGVMSGSASLGGSGSGHTGNAGDHAINLTGNDNAQDRMTVSAAQFTPLRNNLDSFSVTTWVKMLTPGGIGDHAGTNGYDLTTARGNINLVIGNGVGGGGTGFEVPSTTDVFIETDNTWQHLALVIDRDSDTFDVYVDGVAATNYNFAWNPGGVWSPNSIPASITHIATDAADLRLGDKNGNTGFGGFLDDYAIYDVALTQSQIQGLVDRTLTPATVDGPACSPGDTDGDGDIDTVDLTTAITNFTGAGGSGKACEDGDTDDDGDVDTVDLTFSISNFTGALAGDPNVPDLIYDPASGNVSLDTQGQDVISFSLQGGPFNTGNTDFSGLPAGLSDNIANQIGWTSFNIGGGLVGSADLGAILPAGLSEAQFLAALAGGANYGLSVVTGSGGPLDLVYLPEPGSLVLMGMSALALVRRTRRFADSARHVGSATST